MVRQAAGEKKTDNDLLKQLSHTIPSGFLPQFLVSSLFFFHIWRWNMKGFLKAWRYRGLLDVPPPAGCFNHTHNNTLSGMLKAQPRHRGSSLDVSKGSVLEIQQERCEEEKKI